MNSIEDEDTEEVHKWLNEPDQNPTRTYEVNDQINGRYYIYGHSSKYSEVTVEQNDKAIILTFINEKKKSSDQDVLVKIKINPNIIDSVVLKNE
jgi:hypothetical protein